MAQIKFVNVNKVYDNNVQAVFDFNLDVEDKEFIVLVGPSGCGKSTTLRMLAGLEEISSGELYLDGNLINDVDPKDRDIAMVFQSYALYPHMTVYNNMAFGLKVRHIPRDIIKQRIEAAAEILGLKQYLKRKPKALSGGQRQRVALGRAIVREPKVFLMDEPLSNLDAKLRVQMRGEIIKIHRRVGATTIYVTHDQSEAMTMADRIVIMKDGYVQQIGTPYDVYNKPINMFVAGFIGSPSMNFISCEYDNGKISIDDKMTFKLDANLIKKHDDYYQHLLDESNSNYQNRLNRINEHNDTIEKKNPKKIIDLNNDSLANGYMNLIEKSKKVLDTKKHRLIIGIRPEDIHIKEKSDKNKKESLELTCDLSELLGRDRIIYSNINSSDRLVVTVDAKWNIASGDKVEFTFDLEKIHIFDEDTSDNILLKYA